MPLFGKKYPQVEELVDSWSILEGQFDASPIVVRVNEGLSPFAGHPDYGDRIGIAIPMNAPNPGGLPDAGETAVLLDVEDMLLEEFCADRSSLLSLIITTGVMREFVFYTSAPEKAGNRLQRVSERVSSHQLQMIIEPDKKWTVYRELGGRR